MPIIKHSLFDINTFFPLASKFQFLTIICKRKKDAQIANSFRPNKRRENLEAILITLILSLNKSCKLVKGNTFNYLELDI